ncbi:hypothetical protein DV515_00012791 [Chloebia gouldiae]|uniref:Linker for activation of T-cells family member 2 n=1 Tax=Chloebia gouldiae TaxID=44316 RepID=A0A3L8S3N8_CHLGU|nr:hypothetical protein DV515_00012791 [Chloebia gouldiae]
MLGLVIHRDRKPTTATSPGGTGSSPGSCRCWRSWATSGTAAEVWVRLESQQRFEVIRSHSRSGDEARYQNFLAENCLQEDTAYVEPISLDHYYNCTRLFKPPCGRSPGKPEKDEDSYSYENVTIGVSQGSDPDEAVDYENSMAILTWKLQQGQAPVTESLDDEPDYINTGPAVRAKVETE